MSYIQMSSWVEACFEGLIRAIYFARPMSNLESLEAQKRDLQKQMEQVDAAIADEWKKKKTAEAEAETQDYLELNGQRVPLVGRLEGVIETDPAIYEFVFTPVGNKVLYNIARGKIVPCVLVLNGIKHTSDVCPARLDQDNLTFEFGCNVVEFVRQGDEFVLQQVTREEEAPY